MSILVVTLIYLCAYILIIMYAIMYYVYMRLCVMYTYPF